MKLVYENKKNILIFSGGKSPCKEKIISTLNNLQIEIDNSFVICADSGVNIATECGAKIDLLLGDFDSLDKSLLDKQNNFTKKEFSKDKDFSDTELAFIEAKKLPYDKIILIGASGGRVDHFIALLSVFYRKNRFNSLFALPDLWLTEENLIFFTNKKEIKIQGLSVEDNVSVFCTRPSVFSKILSKGLNWDLQKVNWKKNWSLSNRINPNQDVLLSVKRGEFFIILPLKDSIKLIF